MNSFFQTRFSTGQVLKAAGVTNDRLQSWIRRGAIIGGDGVEMPGSPGVHRGFTFYSVMEIATAKFLTDNGVPVQQAFKAAASFAHTGIKRREPSFPFLDADYTYLCVSGDRSYVFDHKRGGDIIATIERKMNHPTCFCLLHMNPVFDQVVSALGFHPEAVLDLVRNTGSTEVENVNTTVSEVIKD